MCVHAARGPDRAGPEAPLLRVQLCCTGKAASLLAPYLQALVPQALLAWDNTWSASLLAPSGTACCALAIGPSRAKSPRLPEGRAQPLAVFVVSPAGPGFCNAKDRDFSRSARPDWLARLSRQTGPPDWGAPLGAPRSRDRAGSKPLCERPAFPARRYMRPTLSPAVSVGPHCQDMRRWRTGEPVL